MDWSHHFICCTSLPFCAVGHPLKACTALLWGPEGRVHCEVDGVWMCWPSPLWKNFPFIRGIWRKRAARCMTSGYWSVQLQVWHPWLVLKTFLVLSCCCSGLLLHNSCCPKPIQIPGLGTGTWLSCVHSSQTAYWGMILILAYYYAFETGGHIVKHNIFLLYKAQLFTCQSVYFYKSDCRVNYSAKWNSSMRHLSFSICVGKIPNHSATIYDLYLCGSGKQTVYCIFSNLPSVTVHDLNWNVRQEWKNLCTIGILSNKDSWCLVPFSSNIFCDCLQRVSVLAMIRTRVPYISQRYCAVIQGYSKWLSGF